MRLQLACYHQQFGRERTLRRQDKYRQMPEGDLPHGILGGVSTFKDPGNPSP